MNTAAYMIVALNLLLGFGFAWALSRRFKKTMAVHIGGLRLFFLLTAVYTLECVAFSASMGTYIFSIGLAFLWGIPLGISLRRSGPMPVRRVMETAFVFALYTSLPAVSFLSVPVAAALNGWRVLNAEDGNRFGIPGFVPWPVNSIAGFALLLAVGGVLIKASITMGLVAVIISHKNPGRRIPNQGAAPPAGS